jgi:hypothetical protein
MDAEFDQLTLEQIDEMAFTKHFDPQSMLNTAMQRKYSTFAMYSEPEFQEALGVFRERIARYEASQYRAEIGCLVFQHVKAQNA